MDRLTRRELVLGAGALALGAGAADALAMPARDPRGASRRRRRAGGAGPRALRELARRVRGPVIRPGSAAYAGAARVYNARFDGARPDAVVVPRDSRDVQALLRWADRHDVRVAARSGGHSYAGYSTLDEGVVVDLRRLRAISVDRGGRRASIGAGAHMIEVVDALARHGGAVPGGSCPTVGFGGLALGGGYGLASRAFGLTADNVTGLVVITPDGRLRRVDARHDPDLFWALRGGGGGNFGIVTRFETRVHRVARRAHFSASFPSAGAALAAWEAWAPRDRPAADLGAAARHRQRHRGRAVPRVRAPARRPARPAAARGRDGDHRQLELRARSRSAGATGARRRARRSRRSRTTCASACPAACATRCSPSSRAARGRRPRQRRADPRRLRRRAQPPARPRHGVRAPRRALLDPVPRLPRRRRRGEPRVAAADARDRRPARLRRLPELHRPDLRGWRRAYYGRNLARLQQVRADYDPDRRFRSPRGV